LPRGDPRQALPFLRGETPGRLAVQLVGELEA